MKPNLESLKMVAKNLLRKPEKIVCVGLGKTGTTSFGEAMSILGYKHCFVGSLGVAFGHENGYMWPIYRSLSKYDSFDDFPWPFLFEMISAKYPASKFVLTRRSSPDAWLRSLQKHYCRTGPTYDKKAYYGYYSPYQNPEHHLDLYRYHNDRVCRFFRGRPNFIELCWEEGHGWEELCGFLGRNVPDRSFPHANVATSVDYEKSRAEADRQLQHFLR